MDMARTVKDEQLEQRSNRLALARRDKPYWKTLHEGLHIGYRRTSGKWLVRVYLDSGKYKVEVIGQADDVSDADGKDIVAFKAGSKDSAPKI